MPRLSASTMAGSDPPSRSGATYRVTVTYSSTRDRLQRRLEAERREHVRVERGDLRDQPGLDAHDVELERAELGVTGPAQVARRGGHPVGPHRDQPPFAHRDRVG